MNKQSGYLTGMVAIAFAIGAVFFLVIGVIVGIYLPDALAWAKTIIHGWTAP